MKCFYHNDADGKCAAHWVWDLVEIKDELDIEFIEMDYTKPFPLEAIRKDERVYIVDFSIEPETMRALLQITNDVTWIDHHKTAIEKYDGFGLPIRGIRYDGIAGCMLTYVYLTHMTDQGEGEIDSFSEIMTMNAPLFTKLIADWDVWKFNYGDDTRAFMAAFNAYKFNPAPRYFEQNDWDLFKPGSMDGEIKLIEEGKTMIRFRDGWAAEYCKTKGFETVLEGNRCFAMNLGLCNSEYFKSLKEEYDILMPFCFDGNIWTVSLYSKTIDVSEIAKKYGGGGHKGASGFQCKELPFRKA